MADPITRSGSGYSAPRDSNRVPVMLGVSTVDGITPVPLEVNPANGQLQTSGSGGGSGGTQYQELATTTPATGTLSLGRYQTTLPTLTNGQMNEPMLDNQSQLRISGTGLPNTTAPANLLYVGGLSGGGNLLGFSLTNNPGDGFGLGGATNELQVANFPFLYNGSTWDRTRSIATGIQGVGISDGTNAVNVLKSDGTAAGQNAELVAGTGMTTATITLNSGTPNTQWFDMLNYAWVSFEILTNTTPATLTFQTSGDASQTNARTMALIDSQNASGALVTSTTGTNNTFHGSRQGRYFRISSNNGAGSTTIVITFYTTQASYASMSIVGTVGSNSATGSAVPANAFYQAGLNGSGNLQGFAALTSNNDAIATGTFGLATNATNYVYNGTTLDRQRSATAAIGTTGTGLLGVGNLLFDGTNYQIWRSSGNINDATNQSNVGAVAQYSYNGSTGDRFRNNTTAAVIAAGATASNAGVPVTTYNASKLLLNTNIASGAGTVVVAINGVTASGYTYNILTSAAMTGAGNNQQRIFPGATSATGLVANDLVPRTIQVVTTVVGTISYGIDIELSV